MPLPIVCHSEGGSDRGNLLRVGANRCCVPGDCRAPLGLAMTAAAKTKVPPEGEGGTFIRSRRGEPKSIGRGNHEQAAYTCCRHYSKTVHFRQSYVSKNIKTPFSPNVHTDPCIGTPGRARRPAPTPSNQNHARPQPVPDHTCFTRLNSGTISDSIGPRPVPPHPNPRLQPVPDHTCSTRLPTSTISDSIGTAPCAVHKKFSILFVQSVIYYLQRAPGWADPGRILREIRNICGQISHPPDDSGSMGMALAASDSCAKWFLRHLSKGVIR